MKAKHILIFSFLALASIACKKKIDPDYPFKGETAKYFINGSTEQIAGADYLWQKGDAVIVMDRQNTSFEYKLVDGAGKTSGKFGSVKAPDYGGESVYYAIYPSNLVDKGNLLWPSKQNYYVESSTIADPRCATGSIDGTNLSDGIFYCLGGVLNINVKISEKSVRVYAGAIRVQADQLLSGQFEAQPVSGSDARVARIKNSSQGNNYTDVLLNTADSLGVLMEAGKNYTFSVALPESPDGGYTGISVSLYDTGNSLMGTFTTDDNPVVKRAASASISVEADIQPVLNGEYSVSDSKKVRFASGNLYVDASKTPYTYGFEYFHLGGADDRAKDHMCAFYWSSDISVACADKYSDEKRGADDVLFVNKESFSLYDIQWRALTMEEWEYLLYTRPMKNDQVRYVCMDDGLLIYSDDYDNDSNTDKVILPYTRLYDNMKTGFYWAGDPFHKTKGSPLLDEDQAPMLVFKIKPEAPGTNASPYSGFMRSNTANIRLVTDVK